MSAYVRRVVCAVSLERVSFSKTLNGSFTVESKRFVRALRRKPVKVLFPESETSKSLKPPQQKREKEAKEFRSDDPDGVRKSVKRHHVSETMDQTEELRFESSFSGDKRLSRVVSIVRSRTFREQQGKILLEGRRLICDALEAGAQPQMVFFSRVERLKELPQDELKKATMIKVKFEEIKIWSDVVAPQGVIAIFSRPDPSQLDFAKSEHLVPLSLICDNIRDPGNLGTILRCAAAAGCHNVLLSKGCADPWEPKVLRAAMGAHFRLPIFPNLDWDNIEDLLPKPVTVHVGDNWHLFDRIEETAHRVNTSHEPSRKGEHSRVSTRATRYEEHDSDSDYEGEGDSVPRLEAKVYHENWAQSPSAIIIGGETHGLSVEAIQLAAKTAGQRIFIPVVPEVDSLNSAMAASILLFEGRKQLLKLMATSGRERKND
ncbi:rRNA methyltransferase 3A, mitochondrial [Thalassophryne amazonica]|uniref:rRNA methyltransferase 3A, mitochondrial n=1 Tax=Thalassophryne amazonica TaxID=390379 RepID=UPI0014718D44|nr:rRNA methyltransferase 3A, mitochondrial [Thalassophryne amazonica]